MSGHFPDHVRQLEASAEGTSKRSHSLHRINIFHNSIIGFLLGFSLASSFATYQLLDEYQKASAALQASVMELQSSTERVRIDNKLSKCLSLKYSQVTAHVKRIEAVEKDLKALANSSATHEELSRQRAEVKKLYDGLHIGVLSYQFFF